MLELTLRYPASALAGKQRLTQDDALTLRRWMFPSGVVTDDDAWQLLGLHRSAAEKSPEWSRWFVEAMADFFVNARYPRRCLNAERAGALATMIAPEGVIRDADELELLLHVMELARPCSDLAPALALDQLWLALESGDGVYAARRVCKRRGLSVHDLDFVLRIIRDRCDRGSLRVTARVAAALRRIDVAARGCINHPRWRPLIDSMAVGDEATPIPRGWLNIDANAGFGLEEAA